MARKNTIILLLCALTALPDSSTFSFQPVFDNGRTNLETKATAPALSSSPMCRHQHQRLFGAIVSGGGSTANDDSSQSRNYLGLLSNEGEDSSIETTEEDMIRVRFKNPPSDSGVGAGEDVVILAKPGANLLRLGDQNGVKVPRACR